MIKRNFQENRNQLLAELSEYNFIDLVMLFIEAKTGDPDADLPQEIFHSIEDVSNGLNVFYEGKMAGRQF